MGSAINIKKIAELAQVSTATVSRVINQNGRFSAETEAKVRSIIEEYGYSPNLVAKGLRTSKLPVVGAILPDVQNNHFASLTINLEKELYRYGYSLIICNTNEDKELERKHFHALIQQNVSGIFIISGTGDYSSSVEVPIIYLDRRPQLKKGSRVMVIESDNETGGYLAVRELISCGCTHIATLHSLHMDQNQIDRYHGYQRALEEAGLKEEENLVLSADNTSPECAEEVIKNAITRKLSFDGLMCATDTMAIGAGSALLQCGIRIPEQVCLTGFDDAPITRFFYPSITTIRQRVEVMAAEAVNAMMKRIEKGSVKSGNIQIEVDLIRRASTRSLKN